MTECNGLNTSVTCSATGVTEIEFENTTSGSREATFPVAPGGQIKIDGQIVFQNSGDEVKKAHIRIPT